jgi:hypothetical protein
VLRLLTNRSAVWILSAVLQPAVAALAQVGQVTAVIGTGTIRDAAGHELPWAGGSPIEEDTEVSTAAGSYAMLFFVSGLGAADVEFDGAIVVEVGQDTRLVVQSGPGRRSPIDIHVLQGSVRAFFDAREHREYILLSTPLGRMQVTGSEIYVTHDLPDRPGSVFGTFDSRCEVIVPRGQTEQRREISQLQKVVVASPDAAIEVAPMSQADSDTWEAMPDLNMAAALASRVQVSEAYAGRAWVGEYVTSAEHLEEVAKEGSGNIPTQEPVVSNVAPPVLVRAIALAIAARQASTPGLRSVREEPLGRTAVEGQDENTQPGVPRTMPAPQGAGPRIDPPAAQRRALAPALAPGARRSYSGR